MRILLVGDYPPDAKLGSTKVLVKLQEEFRALGHTCDLLLSDDIGTFPRNPYVRRALGPVVALAAVRRRFQTHGRYDVVDVASAEGIWIGALKAPFLQGTAVVSRSNGLEHLNYQRTLDDHAAGLVRKGWTRRWFHPAVRLSQVAGAARTADRLVLLNEGDRAFALAHRWKSDAEIDLVPHGVSSRFFDDVPPADQPRGRGILFCGTWIAMKGATYLAEAFAELVRHGVRTNLTILGGGVPEAEIRAGFAAETQPFLTLIDRVPEADVMAAYRSHDVMVLPSTYEGFGMVIVEAMSQRLPVIATPVGCAQSLIVPGETGLIVPLRDAHAIADALQRLLADPALRRRLADAARLKVQGMTWTRTAERTLRVYGSAIGKNGNGHCNGSGNGSGNSSGNSSDEGHGRSH